MPMSSARSIKIICYVLLIFIGGFATGLLVAPAIGRRFLRPPPPEELSRHMLSRLQSRLGLTAEQEAKVQPILESTAAEMEAMRRATAEKVAARISQTNREISSLLTPEQQKELEAMERERHARLHGGPPPDDSPPPR